MLLVREKFKQITQQIVVTSLLLTGILCAQFFILSNEIRASEATENVLTIDLDTGDILNLDPKQEEENKDKEDGDKKDSNKQIIGDDTTKAPAPEQTKDIKREILESLFLIDEQQEKLQEAIKHFEDGTDGRYIESEERVEETKIEKIVSEEKVMANIYLNSILYISPNRWSVWINGDKITNETNNSNNEIFILNTSKEKIIVLWKVSLSKWEIIVPDLDYLSTVELNEYNEVENIFTLRPNQTYLPLEDKIIEGKVKMNDVIQEKNEEE